MQNRFCKIALSLLFILIINGLFALSSSEKELIKAIKSGDESYILEILQKNPDVNCQFSNGMSGLYYALKHKRTNVVKLLLSKGADPNFKSGKSSILNWAIRYDRQRIARLLIEYGADVNAIDHKTNSPLIYAARYSNLRMCKILIDRGANLLYENENGKRASDYLIYWDELNSENYLLDMEEIAEKSKGRPSMQDGPYIFRETEDELVVQYFEHLKNQKITRLIEKTIPYNSLKDTLIEGIRWDKNSYLVKSRLRPVPYKFETESDIFAIGDIHGRFKALLNLLLNNKIIDSDLNWSFGKGHLVFLGDIFDRGSRVTETLWFLYELQHEAEMEGGSVNLLLGNHEVMTLSGDHRYLNTKYLFFSQYMHTNYYELFDKESILGEWLRNQNAILQINQYLFMHAGISPQYAAQKHSFPETNLALQNYLNADAEAKEGNFQEQVLGSYGPLWYRGYMQTKGRKPQVSQKFVDDYLGTRKLSHMILGHNEQQIISTSFNGKVVSVDVHINESGDSAQGLLISENKLYRCLSNGKKELLK